MTSTVNANFSDVASKVNSPQQMSLGDMVNMARAAQAYQQAQQLNPLQLEQQQIATRVARETAEPTIASKKAESQRLQFEASKAGVDLNDYYQDVASKSYGALLKDPDFINGNKDQVIKKLEATKKFVTSLGIPEHNSGLHDQLVDLVKNDPNGTKQAYQTIKNAVERSGGVGNQYTQLQASQPQAIYQPPKPEPTTTAQVVNHNAPVDLPHPVRQANVPAVLDPNESADKAAGEAYKLGLRSSLPKLSATQRNIEETASAILGLQPNAWYSSGAPGTAKRVLSNLVGSSQYQQLSKDLAQIQIDQLKAQGRGTDASQELVAQANGTATMNPDVLWNILQRTAAENKNIQLQGIAAQKFANKYGDANLSKFQQEWANNADSRIFQAMNIDERVLDPKEKKKQIDELFNGEYHGKVLNNTITPEEKAALREKRRIYAEKHNNIVKKLVTNGSLD